MAFDISKLENITKSASKAKPSLKPSLLRKVPEGAVHLYKARHISKKIRKFINVFQFFCFNYASFSMLATAVGGHS